MVTASQVSLTRELRLKTPVNAALTLSMLRKGKGDPTTRHDGNHVWRTSRMPSGAVTYVLRQLEPAVVRA
ncbi:MAG: hypothetical protein QOH68_420, partial [Nocardioidaceae bacterium]|nr:hypothetical protein [Nocardioidaceae bacterium]